MSSTRLPTILLIPGSLTTPACYDLMLPHLQNAGLTTVVASLASSNPKNPDEHTAETDGQYLLDKFLLPLIDAGTDVLVFAHSFGATALSGASDQLSKSERAAAGKPGGVVGIVYVSLAMVPEGQSQLEYCGGVWPPFIKLNHPSPGLFVFDPVIETLFNDAEPSVQESFAAGHTPHSIKPFITGVHAPFWTNPALADRRVLIKTTLDATFPPDIQQMFADNSGVDWKIVDVEGGHEAFMTKPMDVAKIIMDAAHSWA